MPETFDGYRRQRHRWRIGPTHELRRHLKSLILSRDRVRTRLAPSQRLIVVHHGLRELLLSVASTLFLLLTVALGAALTINGSPDVPGSLTGALGLLAGTAASAGITWQTIRHAGGRGSAPFLGTLSDFALKPVGRAAGLGGLFSSTSSFVRTNKFATLPTWADGVRGTVVSATLGLITGAGCVALAWTGPTGLLIPATGYLAVRAAGWWVPLGWALYARREHRRTPIAGEPTPTGATIVLTVPATVTAEPAKQPT
jgi:hypothetical protein